MTGGSVNAETTCISKLSMGFLTQRGCFPYQSAHINYSKGMSHFRHVEWLPTSFQSLSLKQPNPSLESPIFFKDYTTVSFRVWVCVCEKCHIWGSIRGNPGTMKRPWNRKRSMELTNDHPGARGRARGQLTRQAWNIKLVLANQKRKRRVTNGFFGPFDPHFFYKMYKI